jgi:hypothetical protein
VLDFSDAIEDPSSATAALFPGVAARELRSHQALVCSFLDYLLERVAQKFKSSLLCRYGGPTKRSSARSLTIYWSVLL